MVAPPINSMLKAAVQSVKWTYSIFWQFCPQQGILRWGDGFYNGASNYDSEASPLRRSQQLRELYDQLLLSGEDTEDMPCSAALSPEDITESEWFYLLCFSFSFHPGQDGLPGTTFGRRQHSWLTGADEADTKTFSRAILAKSAHIQTVVCIPLLEGVVEFGTTDKVQEDLNFIEHMKRFFIDYQYPPTPKPALSANSSTSSYIANINHKLDSKAETVIRNNFPLSELMELDMLEEFRVGTSGGGSNHLDSYPEKSTNMWEPMHSAGLELLLPLQQPPCSDSLEGTAQEDNTHYSQTVSTILQNNSGRWRESPSTAQLLDSAFTKWTTNTNDHHQNRLHTGVVTSQRHLKQILFSIPHPHATYHKRAPQQRQHEAEASGGHVLVERRRREKLNQRFLALRSLVPFMTKMDKATVLGDTIEYVKQLQQKVQELEACGHQMEADQLLRKKRRKEREVEVGVSSEAVLEVECKQREGLLLDVMRMLRELGVEVVVVKSCVKYDRVFVAEFKVRVKENENGKKVSIVEVKKALNQIIPHSSLYSMAAKGLSFEEDVCGFGMHATL